MPAIAARGLMCTPKAAKAIELPVSAIIPYLIFSSLDMGTLYEPVRDKPSVFA
jgi:hypothetical protein